MDFVGRKVGADVGVVGATVFGGRRPAAPNATNHQNRSQNFEKHGDLKKNIF